MSGPKRPDFAAIALGIFAGPSDGTRRSPEQLKAEIAGALDRAFEAGRVSAWPEARRLALTEQAHALDGAIRELQDMRHRLGISVPELPEKPKT